MRSSLFSEIFGDSERDADIMRDARIRVAGWNEAIETAARLCVLQVKDWHPEENAKAVALDTARSCEAAIRVLKLSEPQDSGAKNG